jgi:hypothetical protein
MADWGLTWVFVWIFFGFRHKLLILFDLLIFLLLPGKATAGNNKSKIQGFFAALRMTT